MISTYPNRRQQDLQQWIRTKDLDQVFGRIAEIGSIDTILV
jgi:hypothetical protein